MSKYFTLETGELEQFPQRTTALSTLQILNIAATRIAPLIEIAEAAHEQFPNDTDAKKAHVAKYTDFFEEWDKIKEFVEGYGLTGKQAYDHYYWRLARETKRKRKKEGKK